MFRPRFISCSFPQIYKIINLYLGFSPFNLSDDPHFSLVFYFHFHSRLLFFLPHMTDYLSSGHRISIHFLNTLCSWPMPHFPASSTMLCTFLCSIFHFDCSKYFSAFISFFFPIPSSLLPHLFPCFVFVLLTVSAIFSLSLSLALSVFRFNFDCLPSSLSSLSCVS